MAWLTSLPDPITIRKVVRHRRAVVIGWNITKKSKITETTMEYPAMTLATATTQAASLQTANPKDAIVVERQNEAGAYKIVRESRVVEEEDDE